MIRKNRNRARIFIMQALYQHYFLQEYVDINNIVEQYQNRNKQLNVDWIFFIDGFIGTCNKLEFIDNIIILNTNKISIHHIVKTELSLLRAAIYELYKYKNIPFKVVISEYVKLANIYGSIKGYTFINGVLNSVMENIKLEIKNTGEVKMEITNEVKMEITGEVKIENTDEIKMEITGEVKIENTAEVKTANTDEVKIENTDEVKTANTDEVKTENTDEVEIKTIAEEVIE